ncbi:MAG: single-stranded DNA-binding protein [Gammaproteobacteria bacterium]|nr:single-stranded DNA-binding protein [Gammaproteobacteria bacterium]
MRGFNRVVVMGRVVESPLVRRTRHGTWMAKLKVLTQWDWKIKDTDETREEVECHHVVVFGSDARAVMEELSAGDVACVEGRLRTSRWKDGDGRERQATEIVSETVHLVSNALAIAVPERERA